MTPLNYAAFITTVDTSIGAIYSELDPNVQVQWEYTKVDPMTAGAIKAYGWTGMSPKPRPWYGSRMVYEEAPQTYQVTPIPYELTLGMDRFTLDDSDPNAMSVFWRQLPDMARQWKRHPCYELRDLLEASGVQGSSASQKGLDQTPFFGTAHPIDYYNPTFNTGNALFASGTYCNDFIGTQTINGIVIGGALSTTAIATMIEYQSQIPAEDGETLGVKFDALIVPGTMTIEAQFCINTMFQGAPSWGGFQPQAGMVGTSDNVMRKQGLRIIVNPFLKKNLRWYMADTSHTMKPLLWVVREAPRTVPRIAEDDPIVFDTHRYTWGGWARTVPAWGYSWLMARSGPTGA